MLARIGVLSNNPSLLYMPSYLDSELQERKPRIWPIVNSIHNPDAPQAQCPDRVGP